MKENKMLGKNTVVQELNSEFLQVKINADTVIIYKEPAEKKLAKKNESIGLANLINNAVSKYGVDRNSNEYLGLIYFLSQKNFEDSLLHFNKQRNQKIYGLSDDAINICNFISVLRTVSAPCTAEDYRLQETFGKQPVDLKAVITKNLPILHLGIEIEKNRKQKNTYNLTPISPLAQQTLVTKYTIDENNFNEYCKDLEIFHAIIKDKHFLHRLMINDELSDKVITKLAPKYGDWCAFDINSTLALNNVFCYSNLSEKRLDKVLQDSENVASLVETINYKPKLKDSIAEKTELKNFREITNSNNLVDLIESKNFYKIFNELEGKTELSRLSFAIINSWLYKSSNEYKKVEPLNHLLVNYIVKSGFDIHTNEAVAGVLTYMLSLEDSKEYQKIKPYMKDINLYDVKSLYKENSDKFVDLAWSRETLDDKKTMLARYVYYKEIGLKNIALDIFKKDGYDITDKIYLFSIDNGIVYPGNQFKVDMFRRLILETPEFNLDIDKFKRSNGESLFKENDEELKPILNLLQERYNASIESKELTR